MDNLKVKVGDVVRIRYADIEECYGLDVVEKVLPNGRFKLRIQNDEYWRANGTHNTRARKCEQKERIEFGTYEDYEILYRDLLGDALQRFGERVKQDGNIDHLKLLMLNKMLEIVDYREDKVMKAMEVNYERKDR